MDVLKYQTMNGITMYLHRKLIQAKQHQFVHIFNNIVQMQQKETIVAQSQVMNHAIMMQIVNGQDFMALSFLRVDVKKQVRIQLGQS